MSAGEVRAFLERHGLAARRDLGQNFLCEPALAERLVELAGVEPGDVVIEIGTGLGVLTRALAARAARVLSLEVDAGLVRAHRAEPSLPDNVQLEHADALRFDLLGAAGAAGAPVRLVANLPYAVTGPLLRRLLDLREQLVDWSVMIQREVALRLRAAAGSRDYGSLTVLHRLCVDVERALELAPGCFHPVPRVRSTFLRLRPLARPLLAPGELARVEPFLRAAFGRRRKTLANALRGGLDPAPPGPAIEAALAAQGLDPRVRAEALPPEALLRLARELGFGGAAP